MSIFSSLYIGMTGLRVNEAGLAVPPTASGPLLAAADRLLDDPAERARLGCNAREYAMTTFGIDGIADRFEAVIAGAAESAGRDAPPPHPKPD